MAAAYYKISIGQGETWRVVLQLNNPPDPVTGEPGEPLDLTGYSARMQIRESLTSPTPLASLTSAPGGGITLTPSPATLTLEISDETTASYAWRYGIYDLEIESAGGETTRLLKGEIEISPEVTR